MSKDTAPALEVSEQLRLHVIEYFINVVQVFGLPRSVGQIYGYLYCMPEPVEMEQLTQQLQISLGSVSQGLKLLKQFGAVRVVRPPGARRDQFTAVAELRPLVRGFLANQLKPQVEQGDMRLDEMEQLCQSNPKAADDFTKERIGRLKKWQKQAKQIFPLIETVLGKK